MRINPGGVNRANACASDRRNGESPVLAIGCEQLHCVADASLKYLCQARPDNDRAGVISKVITVAVNQLVEKIGRLGMQSRIDAVKIDSRVLKSRTSADRSAQDRGTGHHIGELPAHPHDFIGVSDAFKIKTASHSPVRTLGGNHERFVARAKTCPLRLRSSGRLRWVKKRRAI